MSDLHADRSAIIEAINECPTRWDDPGIVEDLADAVIEALAAQPVPGTVEYMLRVFGEIPSGAVRATREEILEDKRYVEVRWGKREAVQRTVSEWQEVTE